MQIVAIVTPKRDYFSPLSLIKSMEDALSINTNMHNTNSKPYLLDWKEKWVVIKYKCQF